jgi:PBP1b-binding outer membrane lipoprotein LpoB
LKFIYKKLPSYKLFLFFVILFNLNCASSTKYLDEDETRPSAEWGPFELRATINKLATEISDYLNENDKNAILAISKMRNESSEHIDTEMITRELISKLLQNKVNFIDRSKREEAIKESIFGKQGVTKENKDVQLETADYVLDGVILDNVRYVDTKKIQYIIVSFQMTKLSSGRIVWQGEQKFLKESKSPLVKW